MQAQNLVPFPSRLESLESEAKQHLETMRLSWQAFVEIVMNIQESNLWRQDGQTWDSYCRKTFGLSSARIRQYKAAVPYAEIIESVTGVVPTENQIRNLREVVQDDSLLIPVFKKASELATNPTKRHFEAIASVYQEAQATNAVSVDGESMPVTPVSLNAAQQEAIIEADKRYRQHIVESKPSQKLTVDVNAALLEAIPALPKTMLGKQVTLLWRKEDGNEIY